MRIKIPRSKALTVLFVIFLMFTSTFWAQIYVSLNMDAGLGIYEDVESLQLMAVDWNSDGRRVLQREGDVLKVDLGDWVVGTSKTYPAAFAIVNPADKSFTISSVSLAGAPKNLQIYLHKNMTRPSNAGLVNVDTIEENQDTMLYYDNGTVYDHGSGGWALGPGSGYSAEDDLIYENETYQATATKVGSVWTYDRGGPREAEEGTANFVWVEMSVTSSDADPAARYKGPMELVIEGDYEPGPTMTFMGSGRRQGGPVIRSIGGNSIRLSGVDLKEGTTVVIPDAFAIVNAGSGEFRVSKIEVQGDTSEYMRVYLHGDPYAPAGDYGLPFNTDNTNISYYDGTDSLDKSSDGWIIGPGFGYDENTNLIYGKSVDTTTATRTAGYPGAEYNQWMYNENANNVAENGISNFVWVEIAYVIPEDAEFPEEGITVDSTITIHLSSV